MKIDSLGRAGAASSLRPKDAAAGGFVLPQAADEASQAPTISRAANVAGLDALLALQGESFGADRRSRGLNRARKTLDGLESLHLALLGEGGAASAAARLRDAAEPWESTGDPGLDAVLAEVEVRRAVELAKLEMSHR